MHVLIGYMPYLRTGGPTTSHTLADRIVDSGSLVPVSPSLPLGDILPIASFQALSSGWVGGVAMLAVALRRPLLNFSMLVDALDITSSRIWFEKASEVQRA